MEEFLVGLSAIGLGAAILQVVSLLARTLLPRLQTWLQKHWKRTLAFVAIGTLDIVGASLSATAAGAASVALRLPIWAIIPIALAGGLFYVVRRAGLPKRLQIWASTGGSGAETKRPPQRSLLEHDGVLWEEIGVIDLNNPFRKFGAGGPLCPEDHVRLGYEDPLTMGRVAVAGDDHRIGGAAGGFLYCPQCGGQYRFQSGVNPAIGKTVREARREAESILEAQRRQVDRASSRSP
jgi:hypothetical protein